MNRPREDATLSPSRIARPTDLPAIVEIYNHAVAEQATADLEPIAPASREAWFRDHPADRRPILVVERDGHVAGWAALSDYRPGRGAVRGTAEISYYVHADHRRRGVGRSLVESCLRLAPGLEIRRLLAIVLASNAGSVALLRGLGFELWGRLPGAARFGELEVDHLFYGIRTDVRPG